MSNMVNDMIIENLFEEVEQMSMSEMAFEIGQPWRALSIRINDKELLIEDVVRQRFENMGGPHG